ncbi:MAG: PadR family transcriptional regulator [Candidatus Hodarchaeales archaeon]|jgi:DNA-binding PadR family transcriptional regulator
MSKNEDSIDFKPYLGKYLSELIILSVLSTLSPGKGYSTYEIIKKIKQTSNLKISFRAGTIYPQMIKLAKIGLVFSDSEDLPSRSGIKRQKSVYSLTPKGLKALRKRKIEWSDLQQIINQIINN